MTLPEKQVTALVLIVGRGGEMRLLQVTVTRTRDIAHLASHLHKARTIDAKGGIPAPEVGRSDKAFGHGNRIAFGLGKWSDMLQRRISVVKAVVCVPLVRGA